MHPILDDLSFCVIDLETTGGNAPKDKIIEIGLVRVEQRKISKELSLLVDPDVKIPEFIQKLTSISQEDIEGQPKIEDVIDQIIEFVGDDILVAHNISFDIPFLNTVITSLGRSKLKNKVLCTNVMTKYLIPELMSSNLNYMCGLMGIDHLQAHRAIEDAKATAHLLIQYLNVFDRKGISKVNQLYYPRNRFEFSRSQLRVNDQIESTIEQMTGPSSYLVTVKGEQGVYQHAIPVRGGVTRDYDFLREQLTQVKSEVITVFQVGHFFNALWKMRDHWTKLPHQTQITLLDYLAKELDLSYDTRPIPIARQFDFVLSGHLVREQLQLFSFDAFFNVQQLVFKFPAHKKRLKQYMANQKTRMQQARSRQKKKGPKLFSYRSIDQIIVQYAQQQNNGLLLCGLEDVDGRPKVLEKMIKDIQGSGSFDYNFPQQHLI